MKKSELKQIIREEIKKILKEDNNFKKIEFNSHKNHNPDYDILSGYIDSNAYITYYIAVAGKNIGTEGMEYYSGPNYIPDGIGRSHSRNFPVNKIPTKFKNKWLELKKIYNQKYKGK